MIAQRIEILTSEILQYFSKSTKGHCARVDFLPRDEARAICQHMFQLEPENGVKAYVLVHGQKTTLDDFTITADYAIELRNRKQINLCLFVPVDIVDATASSLSNSFAVIDGRVLYDSLFRLLRSKLSAQAQKVVQSVFNLLRGVLKISKEQQISYIGAVLELETQGQLDLAGCELWRVGLITDSRPATGDIETTFIGALDNNKRCVRALVRPTRLQASLSSLLQSLLVDKATEHKLINFFRGRSLQNIRSWSQALVQEGFTFENWRFPEEDHSDIKSVTIQRFLDSTNEVERYTHLLQPRGVGTNLQIACGSKSTLIVRWKVDPPHPRNLKYWRVELLPLSAGDDEGELDTGIDLPSREIPASRSNLSIQLDFELEHALEVIVRITPIEVSGQPGIHPVTQEQICDRSDNFFLMPENEDTGEEIVDPPIPEKHTEVTTIALGRLEQAMQTKANMLEEASPQWSFKELAYFNLRLDNKRVITLGLSPILKEIEERSLRNSRNGGMFQLLVDEVRLFSADTFSERYLIYGNSDVWKSFWHSREAFFKRLRLSDPRHLIEVVQWTTELVSLAVRYIQSYQGLLQTLLQETEQSSSNQAERLQELKEVMSLDSVLICIRDGSKRIEESLVVLPIHPLRVAWLLGYNQLLRSWEEQIFERTKITTRKGAVDLASLRLLTPINIPTFAFHADSLETYVFFQNLRFYHAVMLPVGVPDPHRRYSEIATILGADSDQSAIGTIQPAQLAGHLVEFVNLHPYISTLVTTLVNPDRGDFFAEALKQLVQSAGQPEDDDGNKGINLSAFQVAAYVEDEQKSSVQALNRVRQTQIEHFNNSGGSYFLPGLSITLRNLDQLKMDPLPDAHITVISDFTHPSLSTYTDLAGESDARSFTLYGLICRFIPLLKRDATGIVWRYQILTERLKPSEAHPVKAQYSDILMNLYATLLEAGTQLLGGERGSLPVLEVRLDEERRSLLEQLHQHSNWVITLDRFFALDYYDSPHIEGLDEMARKYVLDYSPEFSEGLGHRLMITTSWHEEIGSLLRQAMEEHGIAAIESSVSHLLHHLKIVSGSLALQALESRTSASAAVGLGLVTAWLQKKNRLRQSVLVPVDLHPRLFVRDESQALQAGERRCDLALFTLKRSIVDVTFIEVKWRRGRVSFESLGEDMYLQMHSSRRIFEARFFHTERIDGALQRSHLGNVLRFYFERSRRYKLFDVDAEHTFLERIAELEKTSLELRWHYEGYIVSLDQRVAAFDVKEAKIRVLSASDFDTNIFPMLASFTSSQESLLSDDILQQGRDEPEDIPVVQDDLLRNVIQRRRTGTLAPLEINIEKDLSEVAMVDEDVTGGPAQNATQKKPGRDAAVIVPLGTSSQGGECQWLPSVKGSPHLFIVGIPGQGKSWATTRLLIELSRQNVPVLVLDFHSQFSNPDEAFTRQVNPHILDVARGLPFSPFECPPDSDESDVIANSLDVAEIFAHVTNLGPIQQDTLYRALQSAYKENGFGKASGSTKLEYPTLESVLEHIKNEGKGRNNVDLILAHCRSLLEMNLFRPEQGEINLLEQIRSGLVLDLHRVPEQLQLAAGAFILRKVYKDMFRWGSTDHLRLAIVLDEAHRLAKDVTLPKIMKEGRKFGVLVIVASQELTDFHQGIIGNVGTKIIFRVNHPDSRKVAGLLQAPMGVDLARQISQLSVGTAYVQTPEMPSASKVHMYPLV